MQIEIKAWSHTNVTPFGKWRNPWHIAFICHVCMHWGWSFFEIIIWRDADEEDDQRAKVQMTSVWKSRNWQASPQIQGQKFKVITFKKKKCYLKYLKTGENYGLESWKINLPPSPSLMIFCSKLTVVNELRHTQFLIIHQTFYTDFIFNHNSNSVNWVALISFLENILF